MPNKNLSPVTLSETYGFYLLIRLQVHPEVDYIREYYQSIHTKHLEAIEAHDLAFWDRKTVQVRRDFAAEAMNDEIPSLALTILGTVRNHWKAPIFRVYFPDGYRKVLKMSILERRRKCVVLLEKLEAEEDSVVRTRIEPFGAALQELEDAIEALEEARDFEIGHRARREGAKRDWLRGYRRTFQMLEDHFQDQPQVAEDFFRQDHSDAPEAEPERSEGSIGVGVGAEAGVAAKEAALAEKTTPAAGTSPAEKPTPMEATTPTDANRPEDQASGSSRD